MFKFMPCITDSLHGQTFAGWCCMIHTCAARGRNFSLKLEDCTLICDEAYKYHVVLCQLRRRYLGWRLMYRLQNQCACCCRESDGRRAAF